MQANNRGAMQLGAKGWVLDGSLRYIIIYFLVIVNSFLNMHG